ncbi:1-phosphofructokinase family hexose kinase [Flavobacteriaceae bacterium TP-CH-4]|uniref:1-phosphofructokinase family hexose kinase n=1 Tax=Pelagihabitans pacificus TaxID=2696054 RepID=A0A967E6Y7_9FLAO|nr:1-phosphofructokinase family hexose kinase [Pelagihabitans pacificus]NHF59674.1 1-phosphofructokinase family hexose kinase [Pelagihabitans pacificus]
MEKVITLTVNPAVDKSTSVAGIKPNSKLRCDPPVFEAGGGGINISRVIKELGGTSLCMYLAGGATGSRLKEMLTEADILQQIIPTSGWTRENLAVTDTTTQQQYRFGMPGPVIQEEEWRQTLDHLDEILVEGDYLVASGSLAPGIPTDFYAKVATLAKRKKVRFVLDTSGEALIMGAQAGAFLLKPNLGELSALCGVTSISSIDLEPLAKQFLAENPCELMVVSLGPRGALLVTKEYTEYISAPTIHPQSTIGAGDSMLAGMVLGLAKGKSFREMAKYGVACGTAAAMSPGTQLCKKDNVEELYQWILSRTA